VRSLLQLDNGEIWAATHKGGVAVMDSQLRVTGAVWPQAPGKSGWPLRQPGQSLPPVRIEAMAQAAMAPSGWDLTPALSVHSGPPATAHLPHDGGVTRRFLESTDGSLWVARRMASFACRPAQQKSFASLNRVAAHCAPKSTPSPRRLTQASGSAPPRGSFASPPGASELQPVDDACGPALGNPSVIGLLFDRQQTCGWTPQSPVCIA
jgi:hypothetical protein